MNPKTCACCGASAGRWAQWHNQDTGYGVCRACVDWVMTRQAFGRPDPKGAPLEFCRTYGLPGTHYEPKLQRLYGLNYAVLADFEDTEGGAKLANEFMEAFASASLLAVDAGRIILASTDDKGAKP